MPSLSEPAIVAIGGGTGMPVLLAGLRDYTDKITAVVSVADDGGSSGRLRKELGIIPPGDIRNCLAALAECDAEIIQAFQFRFDTGSLAGHSVGNICLAAMTRIYGDAGEAIDRMADLLQVRGQVIPASLDDITLCAEKSSGVKVVGQSAIMAEPGSCSKVWLEPADAGTPRGVITAINEADLVVIGPGSLFTSVIPNLLIDDIKTAIAACSCPRVFVCNVATQAGETDDFGAAEHLRAVRDHAANVQIDAVIVNDCLPSLDAISKYEEAGVQPVEYDVEALEQMGVQVVLVDVVRDDQITHHDSSKLAAAVISIAETRENCRSLPQ